MAYTLANLATYCQTHGWTDLAAGGATQLDAWINDMIQRLGAARDWPSYRKSYYLALTAPYSTGTVTLTADPTITGSGTTWLAGMAGQEFYTSTDSARLYQLLTFTSTTEMELAQSYIGTTGAGKTYEIRYVQYDMPTDFDRPVGALWDQSGNEISAEQVTLSEWHQLRLARGGTASVPTHVSFDVGGPSQAPTHQFYVHPAPSAARVVRGTYQAAPVIATASVAPDWPEKYRYLLHKLLRIEMSIQGGKPGHGIESEEMQALIEEAYQHDIQNRGPYQIRPRRSRGVIEDATAIMSRINIE